MDSIKHEAIIIKMRYPTSSIAPRGDKVPEFGNINIENVTTKYARHALRMQGLSNQPIQGINVKDLISFDKIFIEQKSLNEITKRLS